MYKRCKGDVQGDALEDMGDIQGDIQGDALGYGAFALQAKWGLRRVDIHLPFRQSLDAAT